MFKWTVFLALFSFSLPVAAQAPAGYYDSANGLTGEQLRTALHDIIDNHSQQTYGSLWTHFQSTDNNGGIVWDMYSNVPGGTAAYTYNFGSDQCGNYAAEGDCYNREHSFPKSWFNDQYPMYSDLFHLYPTDGYVNGLRNNYPFSEVDNPTWTSTNGSKRGVSSYPGYSGNAFEPIDEYKGDFARSYFYMLTRYKDEVPGWNSAMLSGDNFTDWARNVLLQWAADDPVSQKEIDRNNAIFQIQGNRNPYIDHPEFITAIWTSTVIVSELPQREYEWWVANTGEVQFESTLIPSQLYVYDLSGRLVTVVDHPVSGEVLGLPTGLFIVRLEHQTGVLVERFYVE